MKWIIVGLGNPGLRYARHRHNVGFHVVDAILSELGLPTLQRRFQSLVGEAQWGTSKVVLVKPQTYMNLSGEAVAPLTAHFGVDASRLLVVHDELELPLGRLKFKQGGSEAGHRGLLSISQELQSRDYLRLRFGIDRPTDGSSISDFVLSPPRPDELDTWKAAIQHAVAMIRCCCEEGIVQAMNQWNSRHLPEPSAEQADPKSTA